MSRYINVFFCMSIVEYIYITFRKKQKTKYCKQMQMNNVKPAKQKLRKMMPAKSISA